MMLNTKYQGLLVSDKKIFYTFLYISLCKTFDNGGKAIYNLNKLGGGPLGDATDQISSL